MFAANVSPVFSFAADSGGGPMQTTMAVEDIKLTLPELLDTLTPGDEVILTRNQQVVAKLVSERTPLA